MRRGRTSPSALIDEISQPIWTRLGFGAGGEEMSQRRLEGRFVVHWRELRDRLATTGDHDLLTRGRDSVDESGQVGFGLVEGNLRHTIRLDDLVR